MTNIHYFLSLIDNFLPNYFSLALCFVSAVYSLIVGIIVFGYLVYHLWLLYLGTTANERRRLTSSDSHQTNCRLFTSIAQLVCCRC